MIALSSEIIVALISGLSVALPSLIATLFSYHQSNKKSEENKKITIYRLDELEKKVDKHNQVIERVYKIETELVDLKDDIRELRGVKNE